MKFDQNAMKNLLALDDAALWQTIRGLAAASGIALSEAPPPPDDMQRLRSLLGASGQQDVAGALATLSRYRQSR